jgi:stress-induced morphogen
VLVVLEKLHVSYVMSISGDQLEERIRSSLDGVEYVKAEDQSGGCGAKYEVTIVSASFEGKALVMQHRTVHQCLTEEMKDIHALTLKTFTPARWETHPDNPRNKDIA